MPLIGSLVFLLVLAVSNVRACTDFFMNFTSHKLSARTLDLGLNNNWTITSWPRAGRASDVLGNPLATWSAPLGTLGLTANWIGDEHWGFPSFFGDALNEKGLSCSMLTLINSKYEERSSDKLNVLNGLFCHFAASNFESATDLYNKLDGIAIYGPDVLGQHFLVRDAAGASLVIECVDGVKRAYLDLNDGKTGFGIMTNEPTFDWHLENVQHYEWKRTLSRQSVAIPGNFYPEERFLRVHMMKQGMQSYGYFQPDSTVSYQQAVALTAQVLNTVSVPQGNQYGTDTGDSSGEGTNPDHTVWAVIRDHANKILYWRDAGNPTFRRLALQDFDWSRKEGRRSMKLQEGPFFVDAHDYMK